MNLPVKAPPPAAPPPLDIHGFVELDFESSLMNPEGNYVTRGTAESLVAGLNWVLYKGGKGFFNEWTVGGLVSADWGNDLGRDFYWSSFLPSMAGSFIDTTWDVDTAIVFGKYWHLSDTFFTLLWGPSNGNVGGFATAGFATGGTSCGFTGCNSGSISYWNELKLALDDSFTGWPITFNPYVTWSYTLASGPHGIQGANVSAQCFSCTVNNGDFYIGMVPTWNASKVLGVPLTFKVPTYVTVGPQGYFFGGPLAGAPCAAPVGCNGGFNNGTIGPHGDIGVFTTGLTAILGLTWIPANYGNWYMKAGFQWYDLINQNLQIDSCFTTGGSDGCRKDIVMGFVGVGVGF